MKRIKIGFIGGGNMGEAILAAILRVRLFRPREIGVTEPDTKRMQRLKRKHRIRPFPTNADLVQNSQTILLAVKPQQMSEVLEEIRPHLQKNHLLLSIAAGLDTSYFAARLPEGTRLIRIMPNLSITVGEGATGLYASPTAKKSDRALAIRIFGSAGKAVFVEREEWLDVVTALSGSGPAFVFAFLDSLIEAAEKLGLPPSIGKTLAIQTCRGASFLAGTAKDSLGELIARVASKGGTTEAGLKALDELKFRESVRGAIAAAVQRARELRERS